MGYAEQRDAILVHAAATAAAIDAQWLDVSIGAPIPRGDRCIRMFWGGEVEPKKMGASRVLNGELVSNVISLVAFWAMSGLSEAEIKAIDDEMTTFIAGLRTRVLGDSQLGGQATDLYMEYGQPDFLLIGSARWAVLEVDFITDYTEYTIAP
jgi:hypothetical protein